jgi:hypothetical protein
VDLVPVDEAVGDLVADLGVGFPGGPQGTDGGDDIGDLTPRCVGGGCGSASDDVGGGVRGLGDGRPSGAPGGSVIEGGGRGGDVERLRVRHRYLGHDAQPGGLRGEPGGEGDGVLSGGVVVAENEKVIVGTPAGRRVKRAGGGGQRVKVERCSRGDVDGGGHAETSWLVGTAVGKAPGTYAGRSRLSRNVVRPWLPG